MSADDGTVAIVGMAVLLPAAPDLESYWQNLAQGVDAITEVPAHRWDPSYYDPAAATGAPRADRIYCCRGGFVDGLATFDPTQFGIMPGSVPDTEPDHLIALRVAAAALRDAGADERRLRARDRIGVILGRGGYLSPGLVRLDQRVRVSAQLVRTLGELLPDLSAAQLDQVREVFTDRLGPHQPEAVIGLVPNLAASRIANRLDLHGPAYTVDAACASALVAVHQAVAELTSGRCDMVLAGGVHHCHDITLWSVFAQLRALSPSQRIRPFDRAADGILIGEGTGVVVLKRLADAERDGDRIYAVIRGTGVASDGRSTSLLHPESRGQALALRRAWEAARLDPAEPGSLGLLEAHGTATPAGDRAELQTLRLVFGQDAGQPQAVIGSVKSMIGHAMPAAGVAGLIKAALAVHRGVLPPTLHCDDPHPLLAGTRFRPIATAQPWECGGGRDGTAGRDGTGGRIRRAAVNAFGFGGINAHVVLEQHPSGVPGDSSGLGRRRPVRAVRVGEAVRVLRLAADTPGGLAELLDQDDGVVRALGGADPASRSTAGESAGTGRAGTGCRLGIVDPSPRRLGVARKIVARGTVWRGRDDVWFSPRPMLGGDDHGRLAFVFPGLEATFSPRVDDVAARFGLPCPDLSTGSLGHHGRAVIALGWFLDRVLRRLTIRPDAVAGHSVGEWTAMAAGGMHSERDVDAFLRSYDPESLRVPGVAFAALGCGADRVRDAIADRPDLVISHENAPSQTIVCGPTASVHSVLDWCRRQHVLGQVLPFRSGFHTPMLAPYLAPIREAAQRFELHPPSVPVWSATTATPYPRHEADVRSLFVRHLLEPVRFQALIEAMYAAGFRVFVQVGQGELGALIDDILRQRDHLAVPACVPRRGGLDQLRCVVTALWVAGGAPLPVEDWRPGDAARPEGAARPGGELVPLDLSAALVSLDARAPLEVPVPPVAPVPPTPPTPPVAPVSDLAASIARLDELAGRFPLAAGLTGLLKETAATVTALIEARAQNGLPREPGDAAPSAAGEASTVLRVNLRTMPYLRDHCFFAQRNGWPDDADRWPVVPGTTLAQHMIDAAERMYPGRRAVAVHDLRLHRWLLATPPVDVPVTVVPQGPNRVRVEIGSYCQAVVDLDTHYPRAPLPHDEPRGERRPEITAEQLYQHRWIFHGPAFQAVTRLIGIGERHLRAELTTPEVPGGLLDGVGHLVGYWVKATQPDKPALLPARVGQIQFFGPHPAPGTTLECLVRIQSITDGTAIADIELTQRDRIWARIESWQDYRFDIDPDTDAVQRFPDRRAASQPRPGGWVLLFERWSGVSARDLVAGIHLNSAEQDDYRRCPPPLRRQWLLGRIAVKDAVRRWWWQHHPDAPFFPAEVRVRSDDRGRPRVSGWHGRVLPELDVSLAHCAEAAVAIVRPHGGAGTSTSTSTSTSTQYRRGHRRRGGPGT